MDAMAVSVTRGLAVPRVLPRHVASVALFFGGFQALMPLLGWLVGARFGESVSAWDHWIAFVVLGGLGAKMLHDSREKDSPEGAEEEAQPPGEPFGFRVMFVLAVATSLDALVLGVTLPLLGAPLLLSLVTIGVTTALLSAAGLYLGRTFGSLAKGRLDALGGIVLIGIGTKTLVQHVWG